MSPGIVLFIALTLFLAQLAYVVVGRQLAYGVCLATTVGGMLLGELVAVSGYLSSPHLGVLHPLADLIAVVFALAAVWALAPAKKVSA